MENLKKYVSTKKLLKAIEDYNEEFSMQAELFTDENNNKMIKINHSKWYLETEPDDKPLIVQPHVFMMMFNEEFKEFVDDLWAEEDEIHAVKFKHLFKRLVKTNSKAHEF